MEFIDTVKKKVPKYKQDMNFGILLSFIREHKLKNNKQLKAAISNEIKKVRMWLAKNKDPGTMNRVRREYIRKLEYFVDIRKISEEYL